MMLSTCLLFSLFGPQALQHVQNVTARVQKAMHGELSERQMEMTEIYWVWGGWQ